MTKLLQDLKVSKSGLGIMNQDKKQNSHKVKFKIIQYVKLAKKN